RRIRMKAVVDQPLRDIHRVYAIPLLKRVAEDHLVHRRAGIRQIEHALQVLADVVCVQDGVFRGLANSWTVSEYISQRSHKDSEIAGERFYPADAFLPVKIDRQLAISLLHQHRHRQEWFEDFLYGDGARAGSAPAVRR